VASETTFGARFFVGLECSTVWLNSSCRSVPVCGQQQNAVSRAVGRVVCCVLCVCVCVGVRLNNVYEAVCTQDHGCGEGDGHVGCSMSTHAWGDTYECGWTHTHKHTHTHTHTHTHIHTHMHTTEREAITLTLKKIRNSSLNERSFENPVDTRPTRSRWCQKLLDEPR
jgi:hypothetical protein